MNTELLKDLLDKAPDMLCVGDAEGYFEWVSPQFETVLGWTSEQLRSKHYLEFVLPADRQRSEDAFSVLREGRPLMEFENRYMLANGGHVWLEWNAVPGADGTLYAVARDITARKKEEQWATERSRLLEMAEMLAGVGHWRVDLVNQSLFWSPHVYVIHGVDPETHTPELASAIDAYHPEDRKMVSDCVSRAIDKREEYAFEARLIQPGGDIRFVSSQGMPELGHDGEVIAVFGIFRDITETRQMEELLRRSERMASVGTMAAGVVHEINNPLSYLLGNLSLIRKQVESLASEHPSPGADELVQMLDDATDGGDRIRRIVEGLRSFSRVADSEERRVSALRIVEAAIALSAHEVHPRATLTTRFDPVGDVLGDENQLVQVVVNLIINAAQAIPAGDASHNKIEVCLALENDYIAITITDSGPGIDQDVIGRVFDPFFTTKPVGIGTGLGLSISRAIVMRHGGHLEALSQQGGGACFTVRLPVLKNQDTVTEPPQTSTGVTGRLGSHSDTPGPEESVRLAVLVVDDEPLVAGLLERVLASKFDVVKATSGRDAITVLSSRQDFVLIICDLMMPEVTGMDVYAFVEQQVPQLRTRFMFATGGTFTAEANAFLDSGQFSVLSKPFEVPALLPTVLAFIDEAEYRA